MSQGLSRTVTRLRGAVAVLGGDGRGRILVTVALGWMLILGVRLVFPALLPAVRAEFDMDLTTAGLLLTLLALGNALGQFPGGVLGDRIGERNILVVSAGIATVMVALLTVSPGVVVFFAATVLFGLATGLFATTRFTVIADVYPERNATAIGVTSAAGNVGSAVLPILGALLATAISWRAGFGFVLPIFLITIVGMWRFVPVTTSGPGSAVDHLSLAAVRRIAAGIAQGPVLLTAGAMFLMAIIYQSFTGFYPTYLVAEKGLAPAVAATLFGVFFATGILIQPLGGVIGDRIGARRTCLWTTGLTALTLGTLPLVEGLPALALMSVVLSVQLAFWPVAQAYAIESLPTDVQGSGFGLLRTVYLIVASLGPVAVGALGDAGLFDLAHVGLAGVAAVALVLSLRLPTTG